MDQTRSLIVQYLEQAYLLALCTATSQGVPWACTVYFAFDEGLNLFFISKTTRRHAIELRQNPCAAGIICKEHHAPFQMPGRGLQIEGRVIQLEDRRLAAPGFELYMKRYPNSARYHQTIEEVIGEKTERRVYQFEPSRIVLFDEEHFPAAPQRELLLKQSVELPR